MTAPGVEVVANVEVSVTDGVATVRFGSGQRLNALGLADWAELEVAATTLSEDESLRAVVFRGRGGAFCSGSHLGEWDGASPEEVRASFERMERAFRAIEDLRVPTIASIEGAAAGGGLQLALACDLQLTSATARLGMPISRLGILVPASFASRLSLRIGPARTKELLYGGRLLSAEEAHRVGLITAVVPNGHLDHELESLLAAWAQLPAASLRAAKAAVDHGLRPLTEPVRRERLASVADPVEFPRRVAAFLRRRRG
ncbi:MAG TPA: enoyl-CoA hydratase/isomerase family protein [Sinomonas sp.]|nr:enoyl-CoA hydratase/isomerase family protein [Sinomonas sp.]